MYTHTEGVPRDCWEEVATWAGMPELVVDMCVEVEVDVILSKPMNAVFYQASESRPCGFVVCCGRIGQTCSRHVAPAD